MGLTIHGVVRNVVDDKTAKGTPLQVVQVEMNGSKYIRLVSVKDFQCRGLKIGAKIDLPIYIDAYQTKAGAVGLNYTLEKDGGI